MIRGIVVGKFLPPHLGHQFLIESASKMCDQLTILICDRPEYVIPVGLRKKWLAELFPKAKIIVVKDTLDDNDSAGWAKNTIKILGYTPDKVFTSETYGDNYAKFMNTKHVLVDLDREEVPISGTMIRENPWANWQYLSPIVRAYFCKRICIVGAESTGTTTLSEALAKHYKTEWVAEYGRTYSVEQQARLDKEGWKTKDFIKIAKTQNQNEDKAARSANKLLFCDTDSFATSIWHQRYMNYSSAQVEKLAIDRRYELYLLTNVNIPFEDDGIRDGEHLRGWMHELFQTKLRFWDKPYVIISGSQEQRLNQAVEIIDGLVADNVVNISGLERNHWHAKLGF